VDDPLIGEVLGRLADDEKISGRAEDLVLAALVGDLDDAVSGGTVQRPDVEPAAAAPPVRAYLESVEVAGFRGVGPLTKLELQAGAGLTLIVGRNGSGKSSLSEAAELALTGDTKRWSGRSAEWTSGWRNLHASGGPEIKVGIRVDGEIDSRTVRVKWKGDDLRSAEASVTTPGTGSQPMSSLGWDEAMQQYRPFLAYSELSSLIEGRPIDRYNALAPMLGMDALVEPVEALRQSRLAAGKRRDAAKDAIARMIGELRDIDDGRARAAVEALTGSPDLAAVEALTTGTAPESVDRQRILSQLEQLHVPNTTKAAEVAVSLRSCAEKLDALRGTDADRAALIADLLRKATAVHEHVGDDTCPVCGTGDLSAERVAVIAEEIKKLEAEATSVRSAQRALRVAQEALQDSIGGVPAVLGATDGSDVGIDLRALKEAWSAWIDVPPEIDAQAGHLETAPAAVVSATEVVRSAAAAKQKELQDLWRPIATRLTALLPVAVEGQMAAEQFGPLGAAEKWLKQCEASIRAQRFAAVNAKVKEVWSALAAGSNVSLDDVSLGSRKVDVDVSVDGDRSAALGVMSQGELFALALSLFIPRASSENSPFGFVAIDDPVQAMDPIRVDGLARVLDDLAKTRQVIVFTHDDRLPAAMRRLQVDARVISVTRRPKSKVELRVTMDPVTAAIDDARAVAATEGLPAEVSRRVVPGFC